MKGGGPMTARKPTNLRLLEGNPGKRKVNRNEPKPRPISPECPDWVCADGKAEWQRIVPELERLGLLTIVDGAALAHYCQAHGRAVECERYLDQHKDTGFMTVTPNGYHQQLPQVAMAQKYATLAKAYLVEFGLTPASRARLSVEESREPDEMEQLLSGR